jgi:hypothetical protein
MPVFRDGFLGKSLRWNGNDVIEQLAIGSPNHRFDLSEVIESGHDGVPIDVKLGKRRIVVHHVTSLQSHLNEPFASIVDGFNPPDAVEIVGVFDFDVPRILFRFIDAGHVTASA